jgi:hypothetical protein
MRKIFFALALLCLPCAVLADVSSAHFKVLSPVLGAPGGTGSSTSYTLSGTAGEVAHGSSTSTSFSARLGFFNFPSVSTPQANAVAGSASVALSWTAAIATGGWTTSGYEYGQSTTLGGPYTYTAVGNVLLYTVNSLTNNTQYYFVIRALDQSGVPIATSSEVTATPVAPTLTFIVDSGSQSFPPLTPGALSATSSILTATTNNASGFNITLARQNSASTTLLLSGEPGIQLPDKTDWTAPGATTTPGPATASTTQPQTLQFRLWKAQTDLPNYSTTWWGSDDTQNNALFAGIPSTTQAIANRSTPAAATTTLRVLYNVSVPTTQKSGTYTGSVVYSAVANP